VTLFVLCRPFESFRWVHSIQDSPIISSAFYQLEVSSSSPSLISIHLQTPFTLCLR
jgi:hypothetical protein